MLAKLFFVYLQQHNLGENLACNINLSPLVASAAGCSKAGFCN